MVGASSVPVRVGSPEATPPIGKRKIIGEAWASLSEDPLSVQFLWPWFWSLLPGHGPLDDETPWMTFRAIRWLRSFLRPEMAVFEYGTGGSTLFFARRARSLVSIENDPRWHARVDRALRLAGISNCDLRLVPPVTAKTASNEYGAPELPGFDFEAYVRTIDGHPANSFDLVSIDGYARPACVAHAIPRVRPGGYLLLDNSDWRMYNEAMATLARFPRTDFGGAGPFQATGWRTTVWRL